MAFWNFMHNTLGAHVYFIPTLLLALAILVVGLVHGLKQKKRDDKFEKELKEKLDQPLGADAADLQ